MVEETELISRSNLAFINATTIHPYTGDPSITGLFNVTIHPDEDWTILTDPVERRRVQNRIAQRGYRNRLKHSKKASTASSSTQSGSCSPSSAGTSNSSITSSKQKKSESHSSKNSNQERSSKKQLHSVNTSPVQVSTHHHYVRGRNSISESTEWASSNGTPSSTLSSPSHPHGIPHFAEPIYLNSPSLALEEMHVHDSISQFSDVPKTAGSYFDSLLSASLGHTGRLGSWQPSVTYPQEPSPETPALLDPQEFNHADGGTALHRAAFCGHDSVVETLLEGGADLEARNRHGLSALHLVAFKGHQGLARLLLDQGADASARNLAGSTPLHLAAQRDEQAVVRMLLQSKNGDPNVRDARGKTPLHIASEQGHDGVVRFLLERGAKIDIRDNAGLTALHQASILGRESMVKLLLEMGADVHAKSDKG